MVHDSGEVRRVRRVTVAGMAVNVALAVGKGVVGWACGSHALVADAVHSASDLVTDVAVILGVRYWAAPPDEEHPYGHGKIQALVTLFIGIALGFVAFELARDGLHGILHRQGATVPTVAAFILAVVSVAVKEALFRWTRRVARQVRSPALEANAWHHRSDAFSSLPVALALAVACFFPAWAWVDALGALVVAVFVAVVAWQIAKPCVQELIDAGIDDKAPSVAEVARRVPGVRSVHCVRARRYGGAFQADLHVLVDASLSVSDAHAIGHDVKCALLGADLGVVDAVIHVEPEDVRAVVSLGSNVEPRADYLSRALKALSELPCTHLVKASAVIETDPVDVPAEYAGLRFLNQAAVFDTALAPEDFARRMHAIEDALGRVRTVRNGPRTIDLDLIDFGGLRLETPELTLPHPRAKMRAFVMRPLAELGIAL